MVLMIALYKMMSISVIFFQRNVHSIAPVFYLSLNVCRNGAHLEHCQYFQCSQKYKCPDSYCIPHWRVCNGETDCNLAEDEANCDNYTCVGMLHCKNRQFCVHFIDICDGHEQCPLGDDEINCDSLECPVECSCRNNSRTNFILGNFKDNMLIALTFLHATA